MSAQTQFFIGAAVLIPLLCAIALIDLRRMVIPDILNLSLAASGLIYQFMLGDDVIIQLAFAAATLCGFWILRIAHARLAGRIGLGLGDVKFLGAAALWVSPLQLPLLLFIASAAALAFVAMRLGATGHDEILRRQPFGPFLSLGLACAWAYEQTNDIGVFW